ncbi:MAG: AraC family transcriptional regulator [Mycobacterium sp.]
MSANSDAVFDTVYADTLRFFPELVSELGGDPAPLLREHGISPAALADGTGRIGYRLIANLLEDAAAAVDRPDFGLLLATRQGGGSVFGPMGVAMRNSNTLGDALEYARRHSHAHSLAARIRFDRDDDEHSVFVAHDILLDRLPNKSQAIEQFLLLAHLNAVEITGGKARVRMVRFRHCRLSAPSVYRSYFGCSAYFDQQCDGVVFAERDLRARTTDSSAAAYRAVTALIDADFAEATQPMRAQARGVILQFIGTSECTNDRTAAELHLHPRTLHRRLSAEGTTFHRIKDEVRRNLALYYLEHTDLDLTRIAERLGYSEHSVLTRSCVRWFGEAPSRLRGSAS